MSPRRRTQPGFTLLELLVVLTIMALVVQIVMINMAAFIPSSALNSVSAQIQSELDFVRSEAKIQGKPYKLQFDLDEGLYRLRLPPEEKIAFRKCCIQTGATVTLTQDEPITFGPFRVCRIDTKYAAV